MFYRAGIEDRAREAAEAARDEVLHAELRGLENLLACCRDEPTPDEQQVADLEKTIKWLRRRLRLPTPPGEKRRPVAEPEPIIEEPPDQHVCWHWAKPRWGQSCRGNHVDDLLIMFGACRADGDQWFWSAEAFEEAAIERQGFELSAVRARIKAHEAVVEIADGRLVVARENDDRAAWTLRKLYPPARPTPRDPLTDLREAMIASHPDRGGNSADFIEARQRFVTARKRWRKV